MLKPLPRLQPSYYETFRCVGSVCEDTCCRGWRIPVDKQTYEKYQSCSDNELGPRLRELVNISASHSSDESYAEIKLSSGACGFHVDGLCEVQAKLGEAYLSKNCATYPRVMYEVEGVLERSLDLSCPEAARLALTNPEPMRFVECTGEDDGHRLGVIGKVDAANTKHQEKSYRAVNEVRRLMIALMQNRQFTISQRLRKLGHVCERLEAEGANEGCVDLRKIVESQDGINPSVSMPATARFEAVIELILARIGSDATSKRFLDCYRNLMSGLHWTMESTMEDLAARLESAQRGIYAQFLAEHSYILENYLVVYIFRGLFPFGSESVNRKFADYGFKNSVTHHYQMMIADFAVIDTMMSGLAAFYGERFNLSEALKVIQSATKTFEHSISYPGKALELLAGKGMVDCRSMGMLIRD